MKNILLIVALLIFTFSCKKKKKEPLKQLSVAEKIANAHGFEHWKNVSQINFTFNVDRDSVHFQRQWQWQPKTNRVSFITEKDSVISFKRSEVDSTNLRLDQGFVNDKYWLLVPFQLVWDEGTTISEPVLEAAPLSKTLLNKITLTYSNKGGYTPGDAYDIYYSNDFMIKEWVFREGNSETPSLINTFENYKDFNGIKIATEHKKPEGNWNLNFTNIKVKTE